MAFTQTSDLRQNYSFAVLKSFLIWTFTLSVCLLVVGFPLIVLTVSVGSLLAVTLQSVLSVSSVLLVAAVFIGAHLLAVMVGAAALTLKGVHPHEVKWLHWLHSSEDPLHTPMYASCPLTCELKE